MVPRQTCSSGMLRRSALLLAAAWRGISIRSKHDPNAVCMHFTSPRIVASIFANAMSSTKTFWTTNGYSWIYSPLTLIGTISLSLTGWWWHCSIVLSIVLHANLHLTSSPSCISFESNWLCHITHPPPPRLFFLPWTELVFLTGKRPLSLAHTGERLCINVIVVIYIIITLLKSERWLLLEHQKLRESGPCI